MKSRKIFIVYAAKNLRAAELKEKKAGNIEKKTSYEALSDHYFFLIA